MSKVKEALKEALGFIITFSRPETDDVAHEAYQKIESALSHYIHSEQMTPEILWDRLRKECCSTKPYTDDKAAVMVRYENIVNIFKDSQ